MYSSWRHFVGLLALTSAGVAQTYTSCNPTTNSSCPSDTGLSSSTYSVDFTQGADDDVWSSVGTGNITYTSSGAGFTISEKGEAPTIQTSWYFFFGRAEVHMRAASGTGIVSSVVLESDDLDEIDWEWLGGDIDQVQTDYFGKGNTTAYDRGGYSSVSDSQTTTHNYTIDWTSEAITWYIDGTLVRTLAYADAVGGQNFPQTPVRLKLGIWAGGDSDNAEGTIEWAGGETVYSDGPFTMYVESVTVTNSNPASSYSYGDQTGDWSSIKIDTSASSIATSSSDTNTTSADSSDSGAQTESNIAATNTTSSSSSSSVSTATTASSTLSATTGADLNSANSRSNSDYVYLFAATLFGILFVL